LNRVTDRRFSDRVPARFALHPPPALRILGRTKARLENLRAGPTSNLMQSAFGAVAERARAEK
jgi:hypothetical protein